MWNISQHSEIINNLSYGGLQPELRVHVHNVSYGSLQPELQVRFNIDNVSYGSINLISNSDPVTHTVIIMYYYHNVPAELYKQRELRQYI